MCWWLQLTMADSRGLGTFGHVSRIQTVSDLGVTHHSQCYYPHAGCLIVTVFVDLFAALN